MLTAQCDGKKCREGWVTLADDADSSNDSLLFCPQDANAAACSTHNSLDPMIEWGVYKTGSYDPATGQPRLTAHVVTRAAGRANLAMVSDEKDNRGFYLDSWNIKFEAAFPPNMNWKLQETKPENANRQATVSYTTGFTVGLAGTAAGSLGSSGIGLNASYSSSSTTTMNTEEFGITRSTTLSSVSWLNKMQLDGLAESYSQPDDLFIAWLFGSVDVATLPKIARYGTDFHAEASWTGDRDPSCALCKPGDPSCTRCIFTVEGTFSLQMYRAWVKAVQMFPQGTRFERQVDPYTVEAKLQLKMVTDWPSE